MMLSLMSDVFSASAPLRGIEISRQPAAAHAEARIPIENDTQQTTSMVAAPIAARVALRAAGARRQTEKRPCPHAY